jgi:hypothetical protein
MTKREQLQEQIKATKIASRNANEKKKALIAQCKSAKTLHKEAFAAHKAAKQDLIDFDNRA